MVRDYGVGFCLGRPLVNHARQVTLMDTGRDWRMVSLCHNLPSSGISRDTKLLLPVTGIDRHWELQEKNMYSPEESKASVSSSVAADYGRGYSFTASLPNINVRHI